MALPVGGELCYGMVLSISPFRSFREEQVVGN